VTDFLDEKRREITERLKELKPLVDEFNRLEAAATALASALGSAASEAAGAVVRRRGPGRPRGSTSRRAATVTAPNEPEVKAAKAEPAKARAPKAKAARKPAGRPAKRRAGRRKGSGTRAAQALSFVQGQPGITIPELAAKMGINQNYLYRVLPGLEKEGKIRKEGRGWHAKEGRSAAT
jgi:ribosomal protein S25